VSEDGHGRVELLVLEDDEALAELHSAALGEAGYAVKIAATLAAARTLLKETEFDVALLDLHLPDGNSLDLLEELSGDGAPTETIVLSGSRDVPSAIQAMKLGAADYLVKPASLAEIELAVSLAVERKRLRAENRLLKLRLERHEAPSAIVTEAPDLLRILDSLQQIGPSDLPIIVYGESGTGKELMARAVHDASRRRSEPFVAINCAAMPDTLLESELFGFEKGAFTGAVAKKPGLFEMADRGTLFLDEIGDISPAMQVKLLRVLETQETMRLGGTRPVRSDVRIVSASNKDLTMLMSSGAMREDLYYRLNGVTLKLPPLRDRRGDVLPLSLHFLRKFGSKKGLSSSALNALKAYRWPGNVRELQMVIRRAAAMAPGPLVEPSDLLLHAAKPQRAAAPAGSTFPDGITLAELEERYIRHVLDQCQGHRAEAAARLGVTPKTLYNRLGPEKPRRGEGTRSNLARGD
jgi:DNA-binding NtrC family response regulator